MSICILNPSRRMHLWPWNSRLLSPSQAHQNWYLFLSYVCSSSLTIRLVFHHWFVPSCHIHRVFDFLPCPSHLSLPCFRIPSALWGISQGGLLVLSPFTATDQVEQHFLIWSTGSQFRIFLWSYKRMLNWAKFYFMILSSSNLHSIWFLVQNSSTSELVTRWTTLSL